MKLALRALLVLAVAGVATQAGAAAPTRLHTVPYSGFFWTPKVGLIGVGLCSSTKYMCGSGAVELTTDGGRTYRVIAHTPRPVFELQALGRRGALARVYSHRAYSYSRVVFRTLDRGRHWTKLHMRPGVSFATPQIGLGFHSDGDTIRLLHTGDGGRSWRRSPKPTGCFSEFPLLDLVTPQLGWVICGGQPGAGNEEKAVFRTRDGGRTWRELTSTPMTGRGPRGGISSLGYPAGISFARDGFGLMWESRGTLYVTRDGGTNWKAHPRLAEFDVDFGMGGTAFANGTGFVWLQHNGVSERLIETRDFGRTWHVVRSWAR
jgi:photosystem II stability/assembly factor-like uncharacterized protein